MHARLIPAFAFLQAALLAVLFATPRFLHAQATSGTLEGRVFNTRNGEYLTNARITIEGTLLETFTDASGSYRLSNVPAGEVRVRVFHTGLIPQSVVVALAAGQTLVRDFNLTDGEARGPAGGTTVRLDEFVVSTSREMDGAAIAINEQRFASNVMNVVAADEFGAIAEGNVGEFLKFLPGITIDYVGGDARTISMNGVPPNNVPVSIGGFSLASAQSSGTGRAVELEQVSINNIARIEVAYTPTPETTGSALAGSVNMVPRGAFERSRPQFNGSAYVMMRDAERSLRKTPGPIREPTYKIHPGFDFSYVVPVSTNFGFTLSGSHSSQYTMQDFIQNTWRGAGAATSTPTATSPGNLPDTTPDRPYLSDFNIRDGTKITQRSSAGATIDYRLGRYDRISFAFQYALFDAEFNNRTLNFIVNRVSPGNFDPYNTFGFPGAGEIRVSTGSRDKRGTTYMPMLRYFHDGPIWKADAGVGYSRASNHYTDIARGYFNGTQLRRTNVTIAFEDIFYLRPRVITVRDGATGELVDPFSLASYNINTASSDARESVDLKRSAFANLRRDFVIGRVPVSLKAGLDVRHAMRDLRGENPTYTHVGSDGINTANPNVPGGANDNAAAAGILDEIFSQRMGVYGFPPVQYPSNFKLWEYYTANPSYFTINEVTRYSRQVELSKRASEVISAAYVRGDIQLVERRLKLVGGVRVEQTNIRGEGRMIDPTANYQRRDDGSVILGANNRPLLIHPAGSLAATMLTNIDRGLQARKEYLRWFPSLNASFNFTENLIARAGYYHSVGRPDFVQYAGSLTLPDTELAPSNSNRITVNNAAIKAWQARSLKVTLEYYFPGVGLFAVGAFRRDFTNMFGSAVFNATPEFLDVFSLDPDEYDRFDVSTQFNLPNQVRMTGIDFNYKQALTFLPHWARGVQVFANGSAQRAIGDETNSMANYIPRSGSWGVSLSRPKYTARINWNYRGKHRRGPVAAGRSIAPGTYNWGTKRLYIDVLADYYFYKRWGVFANLRNLGGATEDFEIHNPQTPPHAQFRQREDFGSLWTFGVKTTF